MASEAAGYREDVEQARRRFAEFCQAHARDRGYRKSCGLPQRS